MLTVVSPGRPGNGKPTVIVPPAILIFVVAIACADCGREEKPRSLERGSAVVVWNRQGATATVLRRRSSGYGATAMARRWVMLTEAAPSFNNRWIPKADRRMAAVDVSLAGITAASILGVYVGRGVVLCCPPLFDSV